jgi:hypothetical protein
VRCRPKIAATGVPAGVRRLPLGQPAVVPQPGGRGLQRGGGEGAGGGAGGASPARAQTRAPPNPHAEPRCR